MCDACDQPLQPAQMIMTLRGRDPLVRLHADCFLLWDDIRCETAKAQELVDLRVAPLSVSCRAVASPLSRLAGRPSR
jgi:hypothetical protein